MASTNKGYPNIVGMTGDVKYDAWMVSNIQYQLLIRFFALQSKNNTVSIAKIFSRNRCGIDKSKHHNSLHKTAAPFTSLLSPATTNYHSPTELFLTTPVERRGNCESEGRPDSSCAPLSPPILSSISSVRASSASLSSCSRRARALSSSKR